MNNLISANTVSQNDEKPHTAEQDDTAIPHVKIKNYRNTARKKVQYRSRNGESDKREGGTGNGESLKWGIFKAGILKTGNL